MNALYRRDQEIKSADTSVWFMFFAQWFVDSFLRTSREDFRQNTSTQEIDLCQIYGLGPAQTRMLRSLSGGRLKSQLIDGEEFPVFLFQERSPGEPLAFKPEFDGLFDERFVIDTILGDAPDERKDSVFAVGLEHGNSTIGNTILNTLFLREHNRIAGVLQSEYPDWDDDRLFETTRLILLVIELKLVVEEYIRHIGPFDFAIEAVPFIADEERWNRPNQIAIEFNLLYRWHMLVPDQIGDGDDVLTPLDFLNNNPLVISRGLESLVEQCSRERAGKIGLGNTPRFLVDRTNPDRPSLEERTIALMRQARLRSFNDYRESYGLPRMESFAELTSDPELRARLEASVRRGHRSPRVVRRDLRGGVPRLPDDGRAADDHGRQRRLHPGPDQPGALAERLQRAHVLARGHEDHRGDALPAADPGQELAVRRGRLRQLPVLRPWR